MSPKRLAALLRKTADEHLSWDGIEAGGHRMFICHAIDAASNGFFTPERDIACDFLESLGMSLDGDGFDHFRSTRSRRLGVETRQQLRYCWLMFAADLAESGEFA